MTVSPGGFPRGRPASYVLGGFWCLAPGAAFGVSGPVRRPRAPLCQAGPVSTPDLPPVCSAKGCRRPAVWALSWNNPKLHEPERRKRWLACDEHRETLSAFLTARGFLREVQPFA